MGRIYRPVPQVTEALTALCTFGTFGVAFTRQRQRVSRQCGDSPTFDTKFVVYIEDTDCFGVVFYANYFRFFQRALNELHLQGKENRENRAVIVGVKQARYRSAAKLGDVLSVQLWLEEVSCLQISWKSSYPPNIMYPHMACKMSDSNSKPRLLGGILILCICISSLLCTCSLA